MARCMAAWIVFSSTICTAGLGSSRVWFVKADAPGVNNGSSWADAFVDLQDALGVAQSGDEIWVAQGRYTPDRGTGDRTMSFHMICGVECYGGFAGWETDRGQRDWVNNPTVLSGDLAGDDGPQNCAEVSNCCVAHEGFGCDDAACMELYCSNIKLADPCCIFEPAENQWRAECAKAASLACCDLGDWNACENALEIVQVYGCEADTVFDGFIVRGAYYNRKRDFPEFSRGMGLLAEHSSMLVSNCTFEQNVFKAVHLEESDMTFTRCQFNDNPDHALWITYGNPTFIDCSFSDNYGAGAHIGGNGHFRGCIFERSHAQGAVCSDFICTFEDCTFSDNGAIGLQGLDLIHAIGIVSNSDFLRNNGAIDIGDSAVLVRNCRFIGNWGNPVVDSHFSSASLDNCLFANNVDIYHNKVIRHQHGRIMELNNCTFFRNLLGVPAPIQISFSGSLILNRTIFWGADGYDAFPDKLLRDSFDEGTIIVNYSIVQGWSGALGGEGNSGVHPMFADPDGADDILGTDDDDFRVAPGSPAINAGDPAFVPTSGETDLDGHARVLCGVVDIGAYEFGIGDFNCDQSVDLGDHSLWEDCRTNPGPSYLRPGCEAFDFNADSDIDLADFAHLQRVLVAP